MEGFDYFVCDQKNEVVAGGSCVMGETLLCCASRWRLGKGVCVLPGMAIGEQNFDAAEKGGNQALLKARWSPEHKPKV
jgi:hypothetical protein